MSDKSSIINEAQRCLAKGQIDKAIAEWEKLLKEYPDGNSYNTVGDLYLKKGDKKNAVDLFHKAANFFMHEGFSLKALAIYKKILNVNPTDSDALFSIGELSEEKGLTTDALKYYLSAAESLSKEGKKEKLIGVYDKVFSISPTNIPLRNKVAEIYANEGLTSEAVKQYFQIAMLYAEEGDIEKSIGYYYKVLDIQHLNKEAILGINYLYERTGNLERALEQIKEATTQFPQDIDIHLRYAELNIMMGRLNEAQEGLRKVIELDPANTKARRLFGDIYLKEGDREKAWTEYLPVLDEMILEKNYDDAVKLLDSFKDVNPLETKKKLISLYKQIGDQVQVANELISLGDMHTEMDMQKEALENYKEALAITPDSEPLRAKIVELETELSAERVSVKAEKTVDEAIIEADIFLRHGLYENVKNLLEAFRHKEPENVDLHLKLKSLYVDTDDKEQAVTECLILNKLYKKAGDIIKSEQMIKEALKLYPEDPRLVGIAAPSPHEKEAVTVTPPEGPSIEDYKDEIAQADFYSKQGLIDEARGILNRLQSIFPENDELDQKLASLDQVMEGVEEEKRKRALAEGEISEVKKIHEPALEGEVLEVFSEFKKGLDKELEAEDYETHYDLGIAYNEMELIDDAIREFQLSLKDPKRFIHSSNMLGICYMKKGLYPLAIDVLKNAIEKIEDRGESYWTMKYDLAEAYEKNGNTKEALDSYTEIYGWNSKFRNVSDKITHLREVCGVEQKKPKGRKDRVSYL
jgi:tetratricopeptide (TPR) repeat protein